MYHTFQNPKRDQFIKFQPENAINPESLKYEAAIQPAGDFTTFDLPYDFASIVQYEAFVSWSFNLSRVLIFSLKPSSFLRTICHVLFTLFLFVPSNLMNSLHFVHAV